MGITLQTVISFIIGVLLAFGSFIYLVIKMIQYENSGEDDEMLDLQKERKTDTSSKTTCGNNVRRK